MIRWDMCCFAYHDKIKVQAQMEQMHTRIQFNEWNGIELNGNPVYNENRNIAMWDLNGMDYLRLDSH